MMFTDETIKKAETAASAEDLLEMAKAEKIELSADEAARYYSLLHGSSELSEADLEQIAGGKGEKKPPDPKYQVGQTFEYKWPGSIKEGTITATRTRYSSTSGWCYNVHYFLKKTRTESREISEDTIEYLETNENITVHW